MLHFIIKNKTVFIALFSAIKFVRRPLDQRILEGRQVELVVEITTADVEGFWSKDGVRLSNSEKYQVGIFNVKYQTDFLQQIENL